MQQPQPRAPTWSYHRYLLLLSAAYYYCLLWTCSTMKTNSPRPCPTAFGTIYLPVFFTLCDGFIYSINCGCHAAKWSYHREKSALDFAVQLFALSCIHRIKANSGAARKKKKKRKKTLRLGARRYNCLKTKALLAPGK